MHRRTSSPRHFPTLAVAAALLLAAGTGSAQAQKAPNKAPTPITVVDAAGRSVGRFESNRVLVSLNGVNAWIDLVSAGNDPQRITWAPALLLFASADCSGTAYSFESGGAIGGLATRVVTLPGGPSYLYLPAGPQQPVVVASTYIDGRCSASPLPSTSFVVPLSAPIELSAQFTTPLTLQ